MDQTQLRNKALPIVILSFLAIGGVVGTIVSLPFKKRQGIPINASINSSYSLK